jgi:hypothetical protein
MKAFLKGHQFQSAEEMKEITMAVLKVVTKIRKGPHQ